MVLLYSFGGGNNKIPCTSLTLPFLLYSNYIQNLLISLLHWYFATTLKTKQNPQTSHLHPDYYKNLLIGCCVSIFASLYFFLNSEASGNFWKVSQIISHLLLTHSQLLSPCVTAPVFLSYHVPPCCCTEKVMHLLEAHLWYLLALCIPTSVNTFCLFFFATMNCSYCCLS